ncbi:uncharacterized protein LODBEIA_P23810 [Lodderomyces beijingensis]|uniref:Uncharacterized protein n=1 Tax=Lodderomyces beijingensis TaxID=1775926 RepID=A0ABP0ZJ41_9ASCO
MQDITNVNQTSATPNIIDDYKPMKPKFKFRNMDKPITKTFADSKKENKNPLQHILDASRAKLKEVKIQLPGVASEDATPPSIAPQSTSTPPRGTNARKAVHIFEDKAPSHVSPTANKRTASDDAGAMLPNKVQSTPKSKEKKAMLLRSKSPQRKQEEKENEKDDAGVKGEEEQEDELACHANHILRMAIDSTMFGSFNSTTLPHLTTVNNSEFNDDDTEDEDSITGERKRGRSRLISKAPVEINEDDLRAAIGE